MSDDLTVLGPDGIRRSYDEHYGTMMDVEQDPTGAHEAIQRQHSRIEELETKLVKALEALEVLSDDKNLDTSGGYYDGGCSIFSYTARQRYGDFDDFAHTTLAELTGGKDE